MSTLTLIKKARIVNENNTFLGDVLIENEIIKEISSDIKAPKETQIIDANGAFLIPGFIDDQVHFREPGLTHKATIATESKAAVAGGITTFIEMPNTVPQATTQELLEDKFSIAAKDSYANYSFMFGGTNDNLEELLKTDPKKVAGIPEAPEDYQEHGDQTRIEGGRPFHPAVQVREVAWRRDPGRKN